MLEIILSILIYLEKIMNYFKSKKQIIMALCLTLSVMSSISNTSANDKCFPAGQEFLLDARLNSSWYSNNVYPYVYMFGDNKHNTWIKLKKYGEGKYFKWTVPNNGFYGLIFACSNYDIGSFDNCHQQSISIYYDRSSNCYTFNGKYNEGKVLGNWNRIDYPSGKQIFLDITKYKQLG